MLYAELKVNSVNVAVVEQLKNAYSLSYMMAKNTVAAKELPKEVLLSVPQMWIQRKN